MFIGPDRDAVDHVRDLGIALRGQVDPLHRRSELVHRLAARARVTASLTMRRAQQLRAVVAADRDEGRSEITV
jgi:hypothetical protein